MRRSLLASVVVLVAAFVLALPATASAAKHTVTVKKIGTGTGTVKCEVAGSGSQGTCGTYAEGTGLVISATPNKGFIFVGWQDGYCSFYEAESCELTIEEEDITVEPEFGRIPTLAIDMEGSGTVECAVSIGLPGSCASAYAPETELVLYATPSPGFMFVGWSDEHCSFYEAEPCELTMEKENVTVVAEFGLIPKYPLTIKTEGSGTGTVKCEVAGSSSAGPCVGEYSEGAKLKLIAAADPGSQLAEWGGECDIVVASQCEVEMSEEKTVAAIFAARPPVSFTVLKSGTGTGTVTCDGGACASSYSEGKEVTLAAAATSGSTFVGWSGGGCSGAGSCKVAVKAGMTVTATFNADPTPPPISEPEGIVKAGRSAKVGGRNAALKLTCSGGPCRGTLKLFAKVQQGGKAKRMTTIGKASFSLASGASRALKVRISAAAKKELVRNRTLKATLRGTGIVGSTVRLKLG